MFNVAVPVNISAAEVYQLFDCKIKEHLSEQGFAFTLPSSTTAEGSSGWYLASSVAANRQRKNSSVFLPRKYGLFSEALAIVWWDWRNVAKYAEKTRKAHGFDQATIFISMSLLSFIIAFHSLDILF